LVEIWSDGAETMTRVPRASRFESGDEVVVMKFGGTSVEDAEAILRLVDIVRSRLNARPVVVVSALSGVTDQLLEAGKAAAVGRLGSALSIVRDIYVRHEQVAGDLVYGELYGGLNRELRAEFQSLESLLHDAEAFGPFIPQFQDQLLAFGEIISSKLVHAALREAGIQADHVDARTCIITDARYGQASPLWDVTDQRIQEIVGSRLDCRLVPIMGGYIASTSEGIPTTLGRGGSDFSAAIVGAALCASRIEIWTDVDGIMTTDPKLCRDARVIRKMSFAEAAELAHGGAKVLHPATLAPAMRENIPVYVLNSRDLLKAGTEIVAEARTGDAVSAITAKRNVAAVEIASESGLDSVVLQMVSDVFDQHLCQVDLTTISLGRISLLVNSPDALPAIAAKLRGVAEVNWEDDKALVCLVGENIRRQPEVASRVFAAVSDMRVRVVCQGTSDRTISFLVDESMVEEAVQRLHRMFFPQPETLRDWGGISSAYCQSGAGREESVAELGCL
jgi:aspartate kinase